MPSPHSIDPQSFSKDVRPVDDFFRFVNERWVAENPIPAEESQWGSFDVLHVATLQQLKEILEDISRKDKDALDESERKVRDFYRTGMDAAAREAQGDAPLGEFLADIDAMRNTGDLPGVLGKLHRAGVGAFWSVAADQDAKQSDLMALYLGQGGLGLPDRDYYVNDDERSADIRGRYAAFMDDLIAAAPRVKEKDPVAKAIIDIETRLAKASMTRVELRDIEKQYNKMSLEELAALAPGIDWSRYWEALGIARPEYCIVCQPEFMRAVSGMVKEMSLEELKQYLRWHALNGLAGFLGERFEAKAFEFYGRTFSGAKEMKPQWRRVLGVVNRMLDEAVGQLYVKRHFSEDAKAKIASLVENLEAAYRARIAGLDWMGEATKEKALAKLAAVAKKLGYPDKWKDISALHIDTDSYLANYLRAHAFEFDRQMRKIGKPVDRTEWYVSPQTVNACYSPIMNEILFPAAILQPPFFDPDADLGANFGGIGTVIGHELTHGFDDQGAQFDLNGNLRNWWTEEDKARFDAKTSHLAEQFDRYEPLPGLHVNGKLTLGENIADLGGLVIAYDALALALQQEGAPATDGLTQHQRFFINWAIAERGSVREEALRLQIQTDPHAPSEYRVNGPVSNMTEFYEAFDCKEGDALWRAESDRAKIW